MCPVKYIIKTPKSTRPMGSGGSARKQRRNLLDGVLHKARAILLLYPYCMYYFVYSAEDPVMSRPSACPVTTG